MASQQDHRPKRSTSLRRLEAYVRPHVQPTLAAIARASFTSNRLEPTFEAANSTSEVGLYRTLLRKRTLRKMPAKNNLSINAGAANQDPRSGLASPISPNTPHTPLSPNATFNGQHSRSQAQYGDGYDNHMNSPINALPPPPSPRSPRSKTSKIFGNKLASRSATRLNNRTESPRQEAAGSKSPGSSSQVFQSYDGNNSSHELAKAHSGRSSPDTGKGEVSGQQQPAELSAEYRQNFQHIMHALASTNVNQHAHVALTGEFAPQPEVDTFGAIMPTVSTAPPEQPTNAPDDRLDPTAKAQKKSQHKFGSFLGRKTSLRGDEEMPPPSSAASRDKPKPGPLKATTSPVDAPMKTAPVDKQERGFKNAMMGSSLRNRSLDRAEPSGDEQSMRSQQSHKPSQLGPNGLPAAQSSGHGLVSGFRSGSTRAAEGVSKVKKGIFSGFKLGRSSSNHEKETPVARLTMDPSEYRVLRLPLVEQARLTRIAKRLHYCKDKTEFWLPAFPYRCIDYLSDKGTYSEGLYRVPGSQTELQHWMARFDRELDIDLFEQEDLFDVNVVAGMLKRWLSYLPPVIPRDIQLDIIKKCQEEYPMREGVKTPDYMKQKISQLPPWNYYLLFAVTGHISFLHNHREQNKMNQDNLYRCFGASALQVESYIFWWLVWDWRNCWLGCSSEEEFKIKEYAILDKDNGPNGPVGGLDGTDERPPGSSQSSTTKPRPKPRQTDSSERRAGKQPATTARSNGSKSTIKAVKGDDSKPNSRERPSTAHANLEKREKAQEQRSISSSDSSKPSITGQSSSAASHNGGRATPTDRATTGDESKRDPKEKAPALSLPMLSPMKPLSPLDLISSN